MIENEHAIDIKKELEIQRPTFQDVACECVESFFQKKCTVIKDWELTDRLEGKFDHISSLGCSNNFFQAMMTANIDKNSIPGFLEEGFAEEDVPDVLGEFSNTFCGLVMDKEIIKKAYGVLLQALPFYSSHCSFFPKAPGIHGKVHIDNHWLYIGYAIRKTSSYF